MPLKALDFPLSPECCAQEFEAEPWLASKF
jgi:hypothetical protein